MSGVSHTATCAMNTTQNFKRVFLETHFLKRHAPQLEPFLILSFQILTTYFKQYFEEKHVRIFR